MLSKISRWLKVVSFKLYGLLIRISYTKSSNQIKSYIDMPQGIKDGRPYLFVCWHTHVWAVLYLICVNRPKKIAVIMSNAKKNHLFISLLRYLDVGIIRQDDFGDTKFERLKILIEYIKSDYSIFTFLDGPSGPSKKVKKDMLHIAKRFGLDVVPFACGFDNCRSVNNSWDHSYMMTGQTKRFFSEYGSPIVLSDIEKDAEDIQSQLNLLEDSIEQKKKSVHH